MLFRVQTFRPLRALLYEPKSLQRLAARGDNMKLSEDELNDHYDFYVNDLPDNYIPISFEEWAREYQPELMPIALITWNS